MLVAELEPPPRERRTFIPLLWQVEITLLKTVQPLELGVQWLAKFRTGVRPLPKVVKKAMSTYW